MTEQKAQNANQNSEAKENVPNITIEDILLTQRVIAQASARGAFRAEEMEVVGGLYNRITRFIKHHVPTENTDSGEGEEGKENTETAESA